MTKCSACANEFLELQMKFPGLPCFEPKSIVILNIPDASKVNNSTVTRKVLQELNSSFMSERNQSFTDLMVKHCSKSEGVVKKESKTKQKSKQRKLTKKVCTEIEQKLAKNAAMNLLVENESFSSYQRKRLGQSFEHKGTKPKRPKISDTSFDMYGEIVKEKFSNWPENLKMNWSELGRQCDVPGANKGQVVKEIAEKLQLIDANSENRSKRAPRACKAKLVGNEISMPSLPTVASIKNDIKKMVEADKITLGEPCSPYTITKISVVDGEIVRTPCDIQGRI